MEHINEAGQSLEHSSEKAAYEEFITAIDTEDRLIEDVKRVSAEITSNPKEIEQSHINDLFNRFEESSKRSHDAFTRWWKQIEESHNKESQGYES
jgi:hypothetical protein